jgi:Type IV pili methyl-accepting chemotaxis transducer N-term
MTRFGRAAVCAVLGIATAISPTTFNNRSSGAALAANEPGSGGKARINLSGKLKTLSQEIAAASCNLAAGFDAETAREELRQAQADFDHILTALQDGDDLLGVPSPEQAVKTLAVISRPEENWAPIEGAISDLLGNGNETGASALVSEKNYDLLDAADILVSQLSGQYADPEQLLQVDAMAIGLAGRQRMLSQELRKQACELNSAATSTNPEALQETAQIFERSLVALRDGLEEAGVRPPPNEGIRDEINRAWQQWSDAKAIFDELAASGHASEQDIVQVNAISLALLKNMDNIVTRYLIAIPGSEDVYRVPLRGFAESELRAWTTEPLVIEALRSQNTDHRGISNGRIEILDQQWRAETKLPVHPLIDDLMERPASRWLQDKQAETAGFVTEVFVMDDVGLNVAQSAVTSDYWQGDEAKWQETYGNGSGEIHISEVEFDDSTQVYQSQVSLPVLTPTPGS